MSPGVRRNLGRLAAALILFLILLWAFRGSQFETGKLQGGLERAGQYFRQMFPPDWSLIVPGYRSDPNRPNATRFRLDWMAEDIRDWRWPKTWQALVVTMQMAIVGTFLGFVTALPISFLAARTMALPRAFSTAIKTGLNVLRAIPPFIYAVLFVYMVGLGPFPGALGIGVGSFVMLAKLFAESLESVHPAPIEAVKAVGGNPFQVFAYGMLPQALPQFLSQTLYAWELNISAATILGIVGAGGIGFELISHIHYFQWPQVLAYVLVIVLMVLLADFVSYQIRKRYT